MEIYSSSTEIKLNLQGKYNILKFHIDITPIEKVNEFIEKAFENRNTYSPDVKSNLSLATRVPLGSFSSLILLNVITVPGCFLGSIS